MAKPFDIPITATDRTKGAFRSVKKGLLSIKNAATGTAGKLAALAGVGGFGLLIQQSLAATDALAKKADQLGVTTERLQAMHFATSLFTSASGPALSEALVKATKRLGEFNQTGGGAAAVWLKQLNLDTEQLATLSPDKLFERYADAIGGLSDRGKQMAAISALMGDESRALIGLVDAGSDVFNNATKEINDMGIAISRVDAAKVEMANDSWTRTKTLIGGIGTELAKVLAPALQYINNLIVDTAKQSGGMSNFVQTAFSKMVDAIGWVLDILNGLKVAWLTLKGVIAEVIATSIESINELFNPLKKLALVMNSFGAEIDVDPVTFAAQSFKQSADEMLQAAKDAANAPPPSKAFKEGWEKQTLVFQRAAESAARLREEQDKIARLQEGVSPEAFKQPAKVNKDIRDEAFMNARARLDAIKEGFMTEQQLLAEHLAAQRGQIIADRENGFISEKEKNTELAILELQHQKRINEIEMEGEAARQQIRDNERKARLAIAHQSLGNLAALMTSGSKQLFEIGKRAAIANALISAHESIVHSYKQGAKIGGPVLGGVFAATAAIATALQIQKIRSQSFGGGGGNPSGGRGGGGAGGFAGGGANAPTAPAPIPEPKRTRITVLGAQAGTMIDSAQLAEALKEAHDSDEFVIEINGERARVF